jgi:succinoglycan biosynthesis protein ExoM
VCICTYRRPELLGPLLEALAAQETGGRFAYLVVVIDNDHARSAEAVVRRFAASSPLAVRYDVEPRQNIARARNRAVEHATGDFVVMATFDRPIKLESCFNGTANVSDQEPEWVARRLNRRA